MPYHKWVKVTQKWYGKKWVKRRIMAGGIGLDREFVALKTVGDDYPYDEGNA